MGARSAAREAALQMLYAAEVGGRDADGVIGDFWREFPGDAEGRSYADPAVRAEAGQALDAERQVELEVLLQPVLLVVGQDRVAELLGLGRRHRRHVERLEDAVDAHLRR